jgi:hypothetical protein
MPRLRTKPYIAPRPRPSSSHFAHPNITHTPRSRGSQARVLPISPRPSYSSCRELPAIINTAHCIICSTDPASPRGYTIHVSWRPLTTRPRRLYSQYLHGSSRASVFSHRSPLAYHSTRTFTQDTLFPSRRIPLDTTPLEIPVTESPSRLAAGHSPRGTRGDWRVGCLEVGVWGYGDMGIWG